MTISEKNESKKNKYINLVTIAAGLTLGNVSGVTVGTEYIPPTATLFSANNCNLPIDCEIQKTLMGRNGNK